MHVGQYLLDVARAVNPNLVVVAELFTGDRDLDTKFTNTLGLNALIREVRVNDMSQYWLHHIITVHRACTPAALMSSARRSMYTAARQLPVCTWPT